MTRKKITAFTLSVTLSRVMMSCGGTSRASWRNETRTMRSIGANTRMTPGPLAALKRRPRRKITPRSYSANILTELSKYRTTMMTTTVPKPKPSSIECLHLLEPKRLLRRIVTQWRDEGCGIRLRAVACAGAPEAARQNLVRQSLARDDYGTASAAAGRGTDKGST